MQEDGRRERGRCKPTLAPPDACDADQRLGPPGANAACRGVPHCAIHHGLSPVERGPIRSSQELRKCNKRSCNGWYGTTDDPPENRHKFDRTFTFLSSRRFQMNPLARNSSFPRFRRRQKTEFGPSKSPPGGFRSCLLYTSPSPRD